MPVKKATTIIIIESDISNHEIIIEFYDKSKLLKVVNGESSIDQINMEISGLIDSIKG